MVFEDYHSSWPLILPIYWRILIYFFKSELVHFKMLKGKEGGGGQKRERKGKGEKRDTRTTDKHTLCSQDVSMNSRQKVRDI